MWGVVLKVEGSESRVWGLGVGISGSGFEVWNVPWLSRRAPPRARPPPAPGVVSFR